LTHEHVRAKYPAFLFCQETHQVDDDCAISLDDFAKGSRCRRWTLLTLTSHNRIVKNAEESNDNTTTEESRRRRRPWSNWFGRPQRRLTEGRGMLTEFTKPLMAGEFVLEEVAFVPDEESPWSTPPLDPVQPAPSEPQPPQPPELSSTRRPRRVRHHSIQCNPYH
jgi:hypothetical protein